MSLRNGLRSGAFVLSIALVGLFSAASGLLPGCNVIVAEPIQTSSDVGNPCVPFVELDARFPGTKVTERNIVTNDFQQCETGICLINNFQGRTSCPLGQPEPTPCTGPLDASCGPDQSCVESGVVPVPCDPQAADGGASQCANYGGACNAEHGACECTADEHCPQGTTCDVTTKQCKKYVCHVPGSCQSEGASELDNEGKSCCVPGSDAPVSSAVCGQCGSRPPEQAVYCSCRCGPAEGAPDEGNYCECPDDFECKELVPYVGLGDTAGKYCIKKGTASDVTCGAVHGYFDPAACKGVGFP
ncbi:hypothetical protein [Polyangium jinanense]|uniref:Uncharacterized protein n=1 Tax=Polyangium jinanense TaxID=2829994 RepID=A0A9X4ARN7_9BACT|nr:hypothetical protein [Polyangium jinanense]MDC3981666.1 hypothetical protein [Polyangium jinanense]